MGFVDNRVSFITWLFMIVFMIVVRTMFMAHCMDGVLSKRNQVKKIKRNTSLLYLSDVFFAWKKIVGPGVEFIELLWCGKVASTRKDYIGGIYLIQRFFSSK